MRRGFLYLLVALLTFGIGLFFVSVIVIQTNQETNLAENSSDFLPTAPFFEKWARGEKIGEDPMSLKTMKKSYEQLSPFEYAKPGFMDLNNDGERELIVFSRCAGITEDNCRVEIAIKKGSSYKIVLTANKIKSINGQRDFENGYENLNLSTHDPIVNSYNQLFRFNGNQYESYKCWWRSVGDRNKNGDWQASQFPGDNYVECGKYEYVN